MKIFIDIRCLVKDWYSGVAVYTRSLIDEFLALPDNRYELFYAGLKKNPLPPSWKNDAKVKILDFKIPNKILDFSFLFLKEPKAESLADADVIFSPHFNLIQKGRLPRVLTIHDLSFIHYPEFFSLRKRFWHYLQNISFQVKNADRIIAVSDFTKADIIDYFGLPEEKISVIYSGVSEKFGKISEKDEDLINFKREKDLNRPFILYLGAFEPRKNLRALIRVFGHLKKLPFYSDWQLILAGGSKWLFENIGKEIDSSPAKSDIIILEKVSDMEKNLLYNLAKVFVYPSFFEGFGFPPLEAQASGLPVVASNRTSLPEILGSSALLFNPWRLEDLYSAIRTLAENEEEKEKIIKLGFENAKKFKWSKTASSILDVLKSFS